MKYRILIIFFGMLWALAVRAEDVNETIDAANDGHVDIYNTAGMIEVVGWSKSKVEVTGELGDNVEELVLERDDDTITVKVKVPHGRQVRTSSDIVVRVPENSSIEVTAVSADIEVEDVRGEQGLHTVSGDVETTVADANINAQSVSGDVDVQGDGTDVVTKANTVSGDVTVQLVGGEVSAEAVSGDVLISEGDYERVDITTVSGDLYFLATLEGGGRLSASTVNGDVEFEFDGDISAEFDVSSFNGDIENCFGPDPERTSRYAPGVELKFTHGSGTGDVSVSTMNGDIHICK